MGEMVLERFNGRETFGFDKGTISVHREDGRHYWVFGVHVDGSLYDYLPDTSELNANPSTEAYVHVDEIKWENLKDNTFSIPFCYHEEREEHLPTLYYCEHQELDHNQIAIRHIKSNVFHVEWTGITMDVNYYDGSKPDTNVRISGEFIFEQMSEWV